MLGENTEPSYGIVYKKRWLILILFCVCSMCNSYHWIHLNIISDRVLYVWNVSIPGTQPNVRQLSVDWLSMIYLLAYFPLIVPATWLLDRFGLRVTIIIAVVVNAVGAWFKCLACYLAVDPAKIVGTSPTFAQLSGFPVLMFAQTLDAVAQLFILGIPAQLAATWFGEREISTATSIGVLANQLGVAIGFGIPPEVVPSVFQTSTSTMPPNFDHIQMHMMYLLLVGAAIVTVPAIPVFILFKAEPPKPPTYAQYLRRFTKLQIRIRESKSQSTGCILQPSETGDLILSETPEHDFATKDPVKQPDVPEKESQENQMLKSEKTSFRRQLIEVSKNVNFMLLLVSYGINAGVYYALGTLLNLILVQYFGGDSNIGWIGFTMIIAGILGSVLAGIWLDRTKKYRLVIDILYGVTLAWMCGFTGLLLLYRIDVTYVASFFLGLTMTGFLPIGFEFAAELTYPANEGLTSGLINASAQIFGIIFSLSASDMLGKYDAKWTNTYFTLLIAVGFVLLLFVKEDLRRLKMQRERHKESIVQANQELGNFAR